VKRVLLTGATGFIGRHCLPPLLANGYEVHAVASQAPREDIPEVFWHQIDLMDVSRISKLVVDVQPTHLLHLAWFTVPGKYWTSSENLRWVRASLDLLQVFAQHGGQRVVMAGSCAEYDWRYGYCSEQVTPLIPSTLYGYCKHSLQIVLNAFAEQAGLSAAWGRVFFLYGPHEHRTRLVPSVVNAVLWGESARCSHGEQIRDFLYVQDVADAFVALLESRVSGAVNIASGHPIKLEDIVYRIAEKVGRQDLIQLGTLPVSANEPPLLVADVSRLSSEVGWSPRYDLDTGLEQTIGWWKTQCPGARVQEQR